MKKLLSTIDLADVLVCMGLLALTAGLALWWVPAALITDGVLLLALGVLPSRR